MNTTANLSAGNSVTSFRPNEYDYDVVIIGAGVAGCSAAYHLMAQQGQKEGCAGFRLLVVDAGPAPGEGLAPQSRSGTATMEVAPCVKMMVQLFAGSCDDFVRHHGEEGAKRYLTATREGLVLQKGIAGQLWTDEEREDRLKVLGSYYVGRTERDEAELRREFEILSSLMHDDDGIEWCGTERLSLVEGMSSDFCCGIYFPHDAIIDSSMYAKILMKHVVKESEGNAEFWPNTTVRSIISVSSGEAVAIEIDEEEHRIITARKVVVATGALCRSQGQLERLNGLMKPCYSYLVHVPTNTSRAGHVYDDDFCSPNFFTWGYTHDWCYTRGKIRISGEDHFSAYKPPKVEERCDRLSRWTLDRYGCGNSYTDEEITSFPRQHGLYSETTDMVPMVGTLLLDHEHNKEQNICYLLGCNAWGQTILSYCANLVPALLGYQELTESQRDVLKLVSIRRFSCLPPK